MVMATAKKSKLLAFQNNVESPCDTEIEMNGDDVPDDLQIIAQEVQIAKSLGCNDLTQRNKQMKKLRKWLQIRAKSSFPFSQEDFMRIWKGLYYNMWYSDKPLVQEKLAEQIAKLLECFGDNLQYCVDFFGAFLKTMCIEWFGIDQWRIDKFLMLVRRMLRHIFRFLKSTDWSVEAIDLFNKHATETVLFENVSAKGLTMHYFDIFLEELAKVSDGNISTTHVGMFVKPFVKFMATQKDSNLISHCRTRIFCHLLYQSSLGREYVEKYNAWKAMGFPTKSIGDLEKMPESENDDIGQEIVEDCAGSKDLDPRAGNVDVFMPELQLDADPIIKEIEYFLYKEECTTKRRKFLKKMLDLLKTYQNGEFPLGIKTMPRFENKSQKPLIREKIKDLYNLENELYGVDRKIKQMAKRKRRKFLKSLNFHEIDEGNYEKSLENALPKDYLTQRRKRSRKSFMSNWVEEDLSEQELMPKKLKMESLLNGNKVVQKNPTTKNKLKIQNAGKTNDSVTSKKCFKKLEMSINKTKNSEVSPGKEQINQIIPTVLKISDCDENPIPISKKNSADEWGEPLADGEIEYFLPSRKLQLKKANANLVLNPLAKPRIDYTPSITFSKQKSCSEAHTPKTPNSIKRVKIALKKNTSQNPLDYIKQIKSSPDIPYDAKRKPGKGLLKPNSTPSPINPFYKKKIGLKLLNDTI